MASGPYISEALQIIHRVFPGGKFSIQWKSAAEARAHKRTFTQLQKELRLLKRRIAADKRILSSEMTSRRVMVGKGIAAGLAAGILGRRTMGQVNVARRDALRSERLQALVPYEEAVRKIDSVLAQIDGMKNEIDRQLLGTTTLGGNTA